MPPSPPPYPQSPHHSLDALFKLSVTLASTGVVVWLLSQVVGFLNPIIVTVALSFVVTYILLAPVNALERVLRLSLEKLTGLLGLSSLYQRLPDNLPRALSIITMYLTTVLVIILATLKFGPLLWEQSVQFSKHIPAYVQEAEDWLVERPYLSGYFRREIDRLEIPLEQSLTGSQPLPAAQERHQEPKPTAPSTATASSGPGSTPPPAPPLSAHEKHLAKTHVLNWAERLTDIEPYIRQNLNTTVSNLSSFVGTTLSTIVYGLTLLVMVFYFLLDGKLLARAFIESLPDDVEPTASHFINNLHMVMFGFVKTQVLLGLVTGTFMVFVYSLLGVPYALLLGAFFAVSEILPVVGTWIGFTPGIIVLLFLSPVKLVIAMGVVYIYQSIKDNLVAPKIVGDIMGLHPVTVILSLLICAKIAGLVGVLFAIPLASMVNVLLAYLRGRLNGSQTDNLTVA